MSRASTAPVSSRIRSDRVDLPWSTWLMIEKFRMRAGSTTLDSGPTTREGYRQDDAEVPRVDYSERSTRAAGVRAARRPGIADTKFARTTAAVAMSTIWTTGTLGCGTTPI
jgi:hypothetical protein